MATAKYDQENTIRIGLKLNKITDAEIIKKLRAVPSMQGYIRKLIKSDIEEEKKMKKSEIIEKYAQDITDTMIDRYEAVLKSDGRIQYKVYIWSDGEVECLEGVSGDSSWLQPYDSEPRDLYYICTIDMPFFDPWDCAGMQPPEDDAEREEALQSIIDWMMDEYKSSVSEKLESIIEDAKFDEKYGEDSFPPYRG